MIELPPDLPESFKEAAAVSIRTLMDGPIARHNNRCVIPPIGCGKVIEPRVEFYDDASFREYKISGLCQGCQDKVFGPRPLDYCTCESVDVGIGVIYSGCPFCDAESLKAAEAQKISPWLAAGRMFFPFPILPLAAEYGTREYQVSMR